MSGESGGARAHRGHGDRDQRGRGDRDQRGRGGSHGGARGGGRAETVAALTRLLAPAVAEAGCDLEEVDVRPAGRRRLVRVVVDADGGVSSDDLADISQAVSARLDGTDVMGAGPYVLEVTSPGVDRPLTEPRHWRRAAGRLVVAPLTAGGQIEGRVVEADDESVVIDLVPSGGAGQGARSGKGAGGGPKGAKGAKGGPERPGAAGTATTRRRFAHGELGRGRVQVEFRPSGDPGQGAAAGEAAQTRSPAEPETCSPAKPD